MTRGSQVSDTVIRRQGRLVDRLRSGLIVSNYTPATCDHKNWTQVECEAAQHQHRFDLAKIRLMAYLGDEEAREIEGKEHPNLVACEVCGLRCGTHRCYDCLPLDAWLAGLTILAAKLPPARAKVTCPVCEGRQWAVRPSICECNGTGKVQHDTPAERYLLVVAAEAVGRACWRVGFHESKWAPGLSCNDYDRAREALDACAVWIAEPTTTLELEWNCAADHPRPDLPFWVPRSWSLPEAIQAAAKILGEAKVRVLVSEAVLHAL